MSDGDDVVILKTNQNYDKKHSIQKIVTHIKNYSYLPWIVQLYGEITVLNNTLSTIAKIFIKHSPVERPTDFNYYVTIKSGLLA